jgi:hypothetical protein
VVVPSRVQNGDILLYIVNEILVFLIMSAGGVSRILTPTGATFLEAEVGCQIISLTTSSQDIPPQASQLRTDHQTSVLGESIQDTQGCLVSPSSMFICLLRLYQ